MNASMTEVDTWDWPFLLYLTVTILRFPERSFWRMTPRKITALAMEHTKANTPKDQKKDKKGFIDQVM